MAKIGEPHKRLPAPGGARRANTCRKTGQTDRYLCSSFCRRHAFPQTSAIGIGNGRPATGLGGPRHHRLPKPSLHSTATGRVASSSPDSLILHGRCDCVRVGSGSMDQGVCRRLFHFGRSGVATAAAFVTGTCCAALPLYRCVCTMVVLRFGVRESDERTKSG